MSDELLGKTLPQLKEYARTASIKGHSKYTRKNNLRNYISKTIKNRGTVSLATTTLMDVDDEDEDEEEDDEAECETDGRLDACVKNNKREKLLWQCFKEQPVTDEDLRKSFACEPAKIKGMVATLQSKYSDFKSSIVQVGGRSNNYDYTFEDGGNKLNIELKTNKLSTKYEVLLKVPWNGYGQLLQLFLNVKDPKYTNLFKSFDTEGMIREWFDSVIMTEVVPKYGIEGEITYESYYTMLFKTAKGAAKKYDDTSLSVGTRALFKYFHEHRTKVDNDYRASLWKKFSKKWMEMHRFDDALALELIDATLNKKHLWICTTKSDAYIIEGPKCIGLKYKALKTGKDATVMLYDATMRKPSTGETYNIHIKFRFYWKNGGQGVHNLCLQIA